MPLNSEVKELAPQTWRRRAAEELCPALAEGGLVRKCFGFS